MSSSWYAIRTAPMKEFAVETILRRKGLRAFCPTEVRYRFVGKKKVPQDYAMLARYLFASGDGLIGQVRDLKDRGLVNGLIGFAGVPAPIPESAIHRLTRLSGSALPTRAQAVRKSFSVGDRVEIMVGPLQALVVEVASIKGRAAQVIVPMLGTARLAEIPLEALEAA